MGVAVRLSTSAAPFFSSFALSFTPKRCCSSMIASAKSLYSTSSPTTEFVPITQSIPPSLSSDKMRFLSDVEVELVSKAKLMPSNFASGANFSACCFASISVGAMRAHCLCEKDARHIAKNATAVLPLPTSPLTIRDMQYGEVKSAMISSNACVWVIVGLKPSAFSKSTILKLSKL